MKLTKEADDLTLKAERMKQLKFLSESNAKHKRIYNLKIDSDTLKSKVQKLEDKFNKAKTTFVLGLNSVMSKTHFGQKVKKNTLIIKVGLLT